MATVTLSSKNTKITVSGTSINTVNFDAVLKEGYGIAWITMISGTAVNFTTDGTTVTTSNTLLSSSGNNVKDFFEIKRGVEIQCLGGAGSEVFNINISDR
jgi:hypothetical protein